MPTARVDHEFGPTDARRVWQTIVDIERYPDYMPNVASTTVLEASDAGRLATWELVLRGSILRWTERGTIDDDARRIAFEQVSGDLAVFRGEWRLEGGDGTPLRAVLEAEFEIGIPLLDRSRHHVALTDGDAIWVLASAPDAAVAKERGVRDLWHFSVAGRRLDRGHRAGS